LLKDYDVTILYHPEKANVVADALGPDLKFEEEPITILDRQVRKLRTKEIASVKVKWKHRSVGKATSEIESYMRAIYPHLLEASGTLFYFMFEDEHDFWWWIM